jgi:hypothetical protein
VIWRGNPAVRGYAFQASLGWTLAGPAKTATNLPNYRYRATFRKVPANKLRLEVISGLSHD